MIDSRLTWLKHFDSDPKRIAVIFSVKFNEVWRNSLRSLWKGKEEPKIFEFDSECNSFNPLSIDKIQASGCDTFIYLTQSRESSNSIKNKLHVADQVKIAEYSVFPGWNNPRWFVPEWRLLSKGKMSRMIQPSRTIARIAVILFRLLKEFGAPHIIFPCRLIVVGKKNKRVNQNEKRSFINFFQKKNMRVRTGILYTGSFGPLQKFTVEILGENNSPVAYAKIGHNKYTKRAISNEYNTLKRLSELSLYKMKTPRTIEFALPKNLSQQTLIVKTLSGGNKVTCVTNTIIEGLAELFDATLESRNITIKAYIEKQIKSLANKDDTYLEAEYKKMRNEAISVLQNIDSYINDTAILPLSLSHGDFTRWNIRADDNTIYVIDWEEAEMRPPGYDILSFLLAENVLVIRNKPERAVRILYQEITKGIMPKFFSCIKWNEMKLAELSGIFFCVSFLNSALWHSRMHAMLNYPQKDNLYELAQIVCMTMSALEKRWA